MRDWIDVATLVKTKNLKGRFVVKSTAGLPFLLEPGDEVAFVPPQIDAPRRACVAEVRLLDEATAEVLFCEVDASCSQALVGCHCLMKRIEVDEGLLEETTASWAGMKVVDEALGEIGFVGEIIDNPSQSLLEVATPEGKTVLVPVVDEIVRDIDFEADTVQVKLPTGLIDL